MYQLTRLANGLTVATSEMPHMASVALGLWVAVGGRHEPVKLNGVCHFIEHMLFKGTRKRSAHEISQAVEGVGGYLNAFTSEENTCFYGRGPHDHLADILDVLTDMFLNSVFDPHELAKERNVIKEEISMYWDQPHLYVQELLNQTLWPNQPLGRPLTGTPESLDTLSRNDLVRFQRTLYTGAATCLVAAGKVRHADFVKAAGSFARRLPCGKRVTFIPTNCRQTGPNVAFSKRQTEQTQLALGIRTCARHDERRFALRLLHTLLGENMSSRLFQVIREELGLVYNVNSSISFFDDTGDLVVSAGLDPDNLHRALKLIVRELRRLAETPPTASELRRMRDFVLGQFDLGLEGTENQMMWLGEQYLGYGKLPSPDEILRKLRLVTPGAVRAVARDFIRPERMNLALIGPATDVNRLRKLLTG